jgi:hypothetical protein
VGGCGSVRATGRWEWSHTIVFLVERREKKVEKGANYRGPIEKRESRTDRGGKLKIGDWREERITDKPRATQHGRQAVSCRWVGRWEVLCGTAVRELVD